MKPEISSGYSSNGLPYVRIEGGPHHLVIFEGLNFNHRPPSGLMLRGAMSPYRRLAPHFTVCCVGRKPGLPSGYSIKSMSDDYADMVRKEMEGPVDIMGLSTGGPIAQQFAADHKDLVRRLVLAATGYRLSDEGAEVQRKVMDRVRQGRWRSAAAVMAGGMFSGALRPPMMGFFWMLGKGMFGSPDDPSDGLAELEAEDRFDFKERLAEIQAPTLVVGGGRDRLYRIRETAAGIPSAKLILYRNAGHMAIMKRRFSQDVLDFLCSDDAQ